MSDLGTQNDPIFKGRTPGGISCAEFVRAVRKHAISEKMARDNEAIADYAMSCLDEEALDWSETLSEEVQGDWSLLRRALLAEYRGTGNQVGSPSSAVIPKAMIPIPAAAPSIPPMQMLPSVPTPFNTIATVPVPPPISPAQVSSQAVTVQASTPIIRRGRIRMTVGYISYYVILRNVVPADCAATRDISKAAIIEEVDIGGVIEFRFTSLSSSGTKWLGMVWQSDSAVKVGNFAALHSVERLGSVVSYPEGIDRNYWKGAVSVVKCARSVNATLALVLDDQKGAPVISTPYISNDGNDDFNITNDLETFTKTYAWENPRGVQLVFEPL